MADQFDNIPESIKLEYFCSTNFMGLFVSDECTLKLRQLTAEYSVAVKKLGEYRDNLKINSYFFIFQACTIMFNDMCL